jgi:hypothetical protein
MGDTPVVEFPGVQGEQATSHDAVQSLRLLRSFIKLSPAHRREIVDLVEQYARRGEGKDPQDRKDAE